MGTIFIPYEEDFNNVVEENLKQVPLYRSWFYNGKTRVDVLPEYDIFKVGDKIKVESGDITFTGEIKSVYRGHEGYKVYFLEKGIDYTKGERLTGGTVTKVLPPIKASVAETITKNGSRNLVFVAIAAIAGYFLFFRKGKGKKGGKGKK